MIQIFVYNIKNKRELENKDHTEIFYMFTKYFNIL